MGLTAKKVDKPKVQREIAKKGPRAAVLTGLIDVGVHIDEYKGEKKKPARQFIPIFTLLTDTYTTEEGETFNMVAAPYYPISLFEGATRGHYFDFVSALDPENETLVNDERDLTKLLGKACFAVMEHNERDGITYANYTGVQPLPEDYPVPELVKDFTVFDTDNPSKEVFDSLWDRTKDKIRMSEGYAGSRLEGICEGSLEPPKQQASAEDQAEDDIPF